MGHVVWNFISGIFSWFRGTDRELRGDLYAMTGIRSGNLGLYKLALQHRSIQNGEASNERLEFLGDAILSLVIGEYLFKKYPRKKEGFLTEIRSRIVNRSSLGKLAKQIGIHVLLKSNKSVTQKAGKFIYGNALEALIGAIYLDKGYKSCQQFILGRLLRLHINLEQLIQNDTNYKSQLFTWVNRNQKRLQFRVVEKKRSRGIREFIAHAIVDDQVMGEAQGASKKQAEQNAASVALKLLQKNELAQ